MKGKKKLLRLGQFLWVPFIAFLILLPCGIPLADAQTPQEIAKKTLASTVLLIMKDANGKILGFGSGFFVRPDQIATNFHVIEGAPQGTAKLVGQETEYTIEGVKAIDETQDLVILQVAAAGVLPLPIGDSNTAEIGDTVYVAGNPKGYFEGTFSSGIISGIRGDSTNKRLQMTAPVSSGSSGGPVVNGRGQVIGVSFATFHDGQNLNFAIPSNYLKVLITTDGPAQPSSRGKQSISADTYFKWGNEKVSLGDYREAIVDFSQAIRLKPDDAVYHFARGFAKAGLRQHTAAIDDYDAAIRLEPDAANTYYNRGVVKADLEQYTAAINDYDTAILLKPDYANAYYKRGNAKENLGQHAAAINDYDTAILFKDDYTEAYLNRGAVKGKLGEHAAAIDDFDTVIQRNPDYANAYYNRGNAKYNLGQHAATINDYDIAILRNSDYAKAYYNRGIAEYMQRTPRTALLDFHTALTLAEQTGDEHLKILIESLIRDPLLAE